MKASSAFFLQILTGATPGAEEHKLANTVRPQNARSRDLERMLA